MAQSNQELERLKQKYQAAFNLMQQLQVRLQNVNMEGSKLLVRGVAPSAEVKNKVWDQIKLIDERRQTWCAISPFPSSSRSKGRPP